MQLIILNNKFIFITTSNFRSWWLMSRELYFAGRNQNFRHFIFLTNGCSLQHTLFIPRNIYMNLLNRCHDSNINLYKFLMTFQVDVINKHKLDGIKVRYTYLKSIALKRKKKLKLKKKTSICVWWLPSTCRILLIFS